MATTHRTLRHEPEYETARNLLIADDPRYEQIIEVIEWGIATAAEQYPLSTEDETGIADIRVAPSDPVAGGIDPIHVLFTIDDADNASLWWVGRVDLADFLDSLF